MSCTARSLRRICALLVFAMLAAAWSSAQAVASTKGRGGRRGMADERSVINLRDLAVRERLTPAPLRPPKVRVHKPIVEDTTIPPDAVIEVEDPRISEAAARAAETLRPLSPPTSVNFLALEDNNSSIPPDTNGAVGLNHLMVTLNSQVRISDRNGTPVSTVSLDSFWASLGAPNAFDPRVLYDPFENRWIFSAAADAFRANSAVLIGVSQTSDPTGNWNLFKVDADPNNANWADFPSLGFNKDWIVVTVNMFGVNSPFSFAGSQLYVFNKADLMAGGTGLFTLISDTLFTWAPAVTHDNTVATMHLIKNFNGDFNGNGFLRMSTITGPVGSEIFTLGSFVSTPNPWGNSGPDNFAPQLNDPHGIDTGDARMLRVVFRNGSLWCSQTIFLPTAAPTRSAVQWWKLGTHGEIQQRGRIDDSTATFFRAYPVLAVNKNDDMLIGYSVFSAGTFASAAYSFRTFSDPVSTLQSEETLRLGEAKYFKTFSGTDNRWGDYSNSVVDPVNDRDLWTIQEFAASPLGGFDRWGTWWGKVEVANPDFTLTIANPTQSLLFGDTATFNGTLTALEAFSSSVAITCQPGHTVVPDTCNGTTATPSVRGQAFAVTASSSSIQDFAFEIQGLGSDPPATTHSQAVTLKVVDVSLTTPSPAFVSVAKGNTSSLIVFQAVASGSYTGTLTLTCTGLPAGATCNFLPSVAKPTLGSPVSIGLTVSTLISTPDFGGAITINAASTGPLGTRTQSFTLNVTTATATSNLGVDVINTFLGKATFGSAVTFNVNVGNGGPDAANNVVVSLIATGARIRSVPAGCAVPLGNTVTCSLGQIVSASSRNLAFVLEAAVGGAISFNASVTSDSSDPVAGNNSDIDSIKVRTRPFTVR